MTDPTPDQPRMSVAEAEAALAPLEAAVRAGREAQQTGDRTAAPTVWIDAHPQLEAIAAAVWEQCRTEGTSLVVDDPRNIAVAALSAVLSEPTDQAAVTPPPALTEEGQLRARVQVLEEDLKRSDGLAKVGARCMREGHQGQIESGRAAIGGHRFALSVKLGLGTGAPWDAIQERAAELHQRDADQAAGVDCTCFVVNDGGVHAASCAKRATDQTADWDALVGEADRLRREGQALHARAVEIDERVAALAAGLAAVRAAALQEAALHLYTALFPAVYNDLGQKAAEGVNRAVSELRRLADEQPTPDAPRSSGPQVLPLARALGSDLQVWPLARVLKEVRCGSEDWSWE
ncbi:hypothetical protein, partial [Streptomyces sp. C1-2]|uniref:hypothetical protein n=1 Tax=Streptomyces sp. C1-2 TaxID=2720022 RepID=UPI00143276A7